jgi:hypothetical protein
MRVEGAERRLPRIDAWLRASRSSLRRIAFELWTTGAFTREAVEYLADRKSRVGRYEIVWRNGGEVRAYAQRLQERRLIETLRWEDASPLEEVPVTWPRETAPR